MNATSRKGMFVVAISALACAAFVHAATRGDIPRGQLQHDRDVLIPDAAGRINLKVATPTSSLRVEHVRLEPAPPTNRVPATALKFDLSNISSNRLTDVLLEIVIVEKSVPDNAVVSRRVLVGPFTVRADVVLESGYTMNYVMVLRNFSSDCSCTANVDVLSVHSLPKSGS